MNRLRPILLLVLSLAAAHAWAQTSNLPLPSAKSKPELWVWGERWAPTNDKNRQIFVWSDGQVQNLTSAGQNWRILGSKTTKSQTEVWGVLTTPKGEMLWRKILKFSKDAKPTLQGAEFFPQTYSHILAADLSGGRRLVAFEGQNNPELVFFDGNRATSWAWDSDVHLVSVALGKKQNIAVCGFRKDAPFLWSDGQDLAAPLGWRGLLINLAWKGTDLVAVGRGAPEQQRPVQALWFESGVWKTLHVSSLGNFPSFVGFLPTDKVEILGCTAVAPDGHFQVWRWESNDLFVWKTQGTLTFLGPVDFSHGLLAAGTFLNQQGVLTLKTWDGQQEKKLKNWPQAATPKAFTFLPERVSLSEQG